MKGVGHIGVHHNLAGLRRCGTLLEGGTHFFNAVLRNASICAAVQAQHWGVEFADNIHGVDRCELVLCTHQAAVPRHTRLNFGLMRCVQPGDTATPAKTGDAQAVQVAAVLSRPRHSGV